MVPVKKPPPGSLSVNTVGTPTTSGAATAGSTPNIFAAATATPKSMINTTGERDHAHVSCDTTIPVHPSKLSAIFTHPPHTLLRSASMQRAAREAADTCSMTKVFARMASGSSEVFQQLNFFSLYKNTLMLGFVAIKQPEQTGIERSRSGSGGRAFHYWFQPVSRAGSTSVGLQKALRNISAINGGR